VDSKISTGENLQACVSSEKGLWNLVISQEPKADRLDATTDAPIARNIHKGVRGEAQ